MVTALAIIEVNITYFYTSTVARFKSFRLTINDFDIFAVPKYDGK